MNSLKPCPVVSSPSSFRRAWCKLVPLFVLFGLAATARGQLTITDDFNDGTDSGAQGVWTHYAPVQTPPWNEQVSWTFPTNSGGLEMEGSCHARAPWAAPKVFGAAWGDREVGAAWRSLLPVRPH